MESYDVGQSLHGYRIRAEARKIRRPQGYSQNRKAQGQDVDLNRRTSKLLWKENSDGYRNIERKRHSSKCQPLIIEFRLGIMAKSKEVQMEDLQETLMEISEELGNISNELSELNSSFSTIGTMITINMIVDARPELKDKVAPLINELIKGLEITLSDMGEENVS